MRNKVIKNNKNINLSILYCGADTTWDRIQKDGFRRRNAYFLRGFVEHPEVKHIFVFKSVRRATFFRRFAKQYLGTSSGNKKVVDVYVTRVLPEFGWLPLVRLINKALFALQIWIQIGSLKNYCNIVWCYWPGGFSLAKSLDLPGKWIFDVDHNIIDDANLEASDRGAMEKILMDAAISTKRIVSGSRSMIKWYADRGVDYCSYLRNGVDLERFENIQEQPTDIEGLSKPVIGYMGVLSKWIDYKLLTDLAKKRPDWNFVVIGDAYMLSPEFFEKYDNIAYLGSRDPKDIPAYILSFDIGLSLYKQEPWLDGDSMKIFEYLAAGIPVVSTPFHKNIESDFSGLLKISQDVDSFEVAIEQILNWSLEDRRGWKSRCREFIMENNHLKGVFNTTAPFPLRNGAVMQALRESMNIGFGLPIPKWVLEIGAVLIDTETELVLKSRWVVPQRLHDEGYRFKYNHIEEAFNDLI